jgi:hypothetical protein
MKLHHRRIVGVAATTGVEYVVQKLSCPAGTLKAKLFTIRMDET